MGMPTVGADAVKPPRFRDESSQRFQMGAVTRANRLWLSGYL